MENFKGTPAPWKLRNERLEKVQYVNGGVNHTIYKIDIQADPTNKHIVELRSASQFSNELKSNTLLIAASPKLLEALQSAIAFVKHNCAQPSIVTEQVAKWERVVYNALNN